MQKDDLFCNFPEIKIKNFLLRNLSIRDIDDLKIIFDDLEVQKYFYIPEECQKNLELLFQRLIDSYNKKRELTWVIENSDKKPIGFLVSKFFIKDVFTFSKISYVISVNYRRIGLATEALRQIIRILQEYSIFEIHADVSKSNIASEKVLMKLGFETDKKAVLLDQEYPDREYRHLWFKKLVSDKDRNFVNAVSYYQNGKFLEAMQIFSDLIEIEPTNALLYNNRGAAFTKLNLYQEAYDDFKKTYDLGLRNDIVINGLEMLRKKLLNKMNFS